MEQVAASQGLPAPVYTMTRPLSANAMAWRAWSLCFPDCRETTMSGSGFWDWCQVATVLASYGIPLTRDIHRKLRLCLFEGLKIEAATRKDKDNGK